MSSPWGSWELLRETPLKDWKLLTISPGAFLSLQRHKNHSETWTAIHGVRVILGESLESLRVHDIEPGQTIQVPRGWYHSIVNRSTLPAYVLEERTSVSETNANVREQDIERVYDNYGRAKAFPFGLVQKMFSKL
jgi:mannose-6-phosphate isomerase-like protein (cupin superfamily)